MVRTGAAGAGRRRGVRREPHGSHRLRRQRRGGYRRRPAAPLGRRVAAGPAAARRARGGRVHLRGPRRRRLAALRPGRALPHRRALRIDVRADDHRRHRAHRLRALRPRRPLLARAEPLAGRHRRRHAVRRGAAEAGDRRARPVLRRSVGADGRGADAADSQDGGGAVAGLPRPDGGGGGRAARRRAVPVRRDRPRLRHRRGRRLLAAPAVGHGVSPARRGVDAHVLHVPGRRQLRPPLPGPVHGHRRESSATRSSSPTPASWCWPAPR